MQVRGCLSEKRDFKSCVPKNIMYGAVGKQHSGGLKHEQKLLVSKIWALFHKRSPAVVVEREVVKLNGNFEIG